MTSDDNLLCCNCTAAKHSVNKVNDIFFLLGTFIPFLVSSSDIKPLTLEEEVLGCLKVSSSLCRDQRNCVHAEIS